MKRLILMGLIALTSCAIQRPQAALKMTVLKVIHEDNGGVIFARYNGRIWEGKFGYIPDSIVRGKVITATPCNDTCKEAFKMIR